MQRYFVILFFILCTKFVFGQTMIMLNIQADGADATCLNSTSDITWVITNKTKNPQTSITQAECTDWYPFVDGSHFTINLQELESKGAFSPGDQIELKVTVVSSTCLVNYTGTKTYTFQDGAIQDDDEGYANITVEAPKPTISIEPPAAFCVGDHNGKSVSATLTNVPAGCTIDWGNANITTNATLAAGATSAKGNIGAGLTSSATNIKAILKNAAGTPLAESRPYTVTVNPLPTATITPKELCSGAEITAGGGGTYNWTAGGSGTNAKIKAPTVTTATTTTYTVEVTSAQKCKATKSEQITVNPLPTVTLATSADRACVGGTDGVALMASASGGSGSGYTYIWNPTSLGSAATANAKPGKGNNTYKVSVKDNKQCTSAEVSKNVTGFYLGLSLAANPGSVTFGGSSILTATASDGTEPYIYTWGQFAGQTGNEVTATNIQANTTYSVSVKDAKGCSSENNATASVRISGSSLVVTPPTNVGGAINTPFNAIVKIEGGTEPTYKCTWTTSDPTVTLRGNDDGTVSITSSTEGSKQICVEVKCGAETDKQCFNVTVTDPSRIGLTMEVDKKCAYDGEKLTITIRGNGADSYSFSLCDPSSNKVLTKTNDAGPEWKYTVDQTKAGEYSIADFKYKIDGVESTGELVPPVSALFDKVPDVKAQDGLASIDHCEGEDLTLKGSSGDTQGLQYTWNNGVTDGVPFKPSISGTYTVTGTNPSTGCAGKADISVILRPGPTLVVPEKQEICAGEEITLTATIGSAGGTGGEEGAGGEEGTEETTRIARTEGIVWTNGVTNGVPFKPELTAVYQVTATNADGCTKTDSVRVVVNPAPTIISHSKNPRNIAIGGNVGFGVKAEGNNLTYQWLKKEGEEWRILEETTSSTPVILLQGDSITLLTVPKSWDESEFQVVVSGDCGQDSMIFQLGVKECFEIQAELAMFDGIIPDENPGNRIDGWFCRGQAISLKAIITSEEGEDIEEPRYKWMIDGLDFAEEHPELADKLDKDGADSILTWIPGITEDDIVVKVTAYCDRACEEVTTSYLRLKAREFDDVTLKIMTSRDAKHRFGDTVRFCSGDTINFWLATRSVGKTPQYQWQNDIFKLPDGHSPKNELVSYDSAHIVMVMGQEDSWVMVEMTPSPEICLQEPIVADTIFMKQMPWMEPELHIDCSDSLVCRGDSVSMLAIHANAGSKPTFQWQRSIGEPFPDWNLGTEPFATVFVDEDDVWVKCTMTPSVDICYDESVSYVDAVKILVFKDDSEVRISCDIEKKVPGDDVIFEAEVKNLLGEPRYEWYVNEMKAPCTEAEYITSSLNHGDVVYCLVSGDKNCQTRIKSNEIIVNYGHISRDTVLVIYKNERVKDLDMLKEGDDLAFVLFKIETPSRYGAGTITTDGKFNYTPVAGFIGTDEVKYVLVNRRDKSVVAEGYIYITVQETDRFYVPNIITPNGDGQNDTWVLNFLVDENGNEKYPNHLIQVFDRSGKIVFEARHYQNDWGGKGSTASGYVGQINLVDGIYAYIIDLGDGKTVLKSWLEIRSGRINTRVR